MQPTDLRRSQSENSKERQRWSGVSWSSGLADDLKRQTRNLLGIHATQRTVSQGTGCSLTVARLTREVLEDVADDNKLSSDKRCSSRRWVTKHKYVVVTCGPTVDCTSDTSNAVELRRS